MKMDVIALGELLIDFTGSGSSGQGNPLFEANPGGAPCNVLAMLAKLGRRTAFVGKVGDDLFGRMLREAIRDEGIDTSGLVLDPTAHTTLAFVQNTPDGDREFSFYRRRRAAGPRRASRAPEGNKDLSLWFPLPYPGAGARCHPGRRGAGQKGRGSNQL